MKRLAKSTVVFAVIAVLAGCAGAAGQRPATVQEFAGTWHGSVAGREVLGGGLALPARFVLQPDGKWTLIAHGMRSEGTISRIAGDVLELEGRFVPDGGPAGGRLERNGDGLAGLVSTRFFGSSMNARIELERERSQ